MKLIASTITHYFIATNEKIISIPHDRVEGDATLYTQQYIYDDSNGSKICHIAISTNSKYLFAAYDNKWVICWDIATSQILGKRHCKKRITSLTHGYYGQDKNEILLLSDKFGELYATDVPNMKNEPVLCMAHTTSIITDVILHNNYLITSDRDEKIRISNYPNMFTVNNYCLKHTKCVTSMDLLNDSLLVSTGWDHQILIWDYQHGQCISELQLENDTIVVSPEVDTATITTAAPQPGNDGEGDNDMLEKTYNESEAGQYPLKVLTLKKYDEISKHGIIAIIFKGLCQVKLFHILPQEGNDKQLRIELFQAFPLPDTPVDIHSINKHLIALLPSPHYLAAIELSHEVISLTPIAAHIVDGFKEYCNKNNVNYAQSLISGEGENDGMKKHFLDNHYKGKVDSGKRMKE